MTVGKRKTTGSNAPRRKTSRKKKKRKLNWQELKDRIEHKLAGLDREKLKKVLLACGIAAGMVLAVVVAIKMFPVGVLLLALLGLATALRFWERLRWIPGL